MKKIITIVISSSTLIWKIAKPLAIIFILCNLMIYNFQIEIGRINDKDFLFNFLGILLGFSLTIFAFIMSMIDKLRERLEKDAKINADKANRFRRNAGNVYLEIKDDIVFIFSSLLLISLMYIFQKIKIPSYHFYANYYFNRVIFSKSLKLSLFILNLYAIYDLIIISFKISDTTGAIKKLEEEDAIHK